jgi:hypothetical protein
MNAEYKIKKALTAVEVRRASKRRSSRLSRVEPKQKVAKGKGKSKANDHDMDADDEDEDDEGEDDDDENPKYNKSILNKFQVCHTKYDPYKSNKFASLCRKYAGTNFPAYSDSSPGHRW